jgi:hypothetical protein
MLSSSGTFSQLESGVYTNKTIHDDGSAPLPDDNFYKISLANDLPKPSISLGSVVIERENLLTLLMQFVIFGTM